MLTSGYQAVTSFQDPSSSEVLCTEDINETCNPYTIACLMLSKLMVVTLITWQNEASEALGLELREEPGKVDCSAMMQRQALRLNHK